jgi:acyl-CoA hydrolase
MPDSLASQYDGKLISAEEAVSKVQSGMRVHLGAGANLATIIDAHLAQRKDELEGVVVQTNIEIAELKTCEVDPRGESFRWHSAYVSSPMRPVVKERGIGVYIPEAWHTAPRVIRRQYHFDFFFLVTAPMDEGGEFNFGLTNGQLMAIADVADKIVVVVRKDMPVVHGGSEERIHISRVDWIVEDNEFKTPCLPGLEASNEDREIARNILRTNLVRDGATLQFGIGGLPSAVAECMKTSGIRRCGLHTEMLTDEMVGLIEAGLVDNSEKSLDMGKSVFTFCLGTRKLYDHLDHNPTFAIYPVDYTNDPFVIAQQPKMFSLNSAAQIDLTGQVASEQLQAAEERRPLQISGTGGQLDFVLGTLFSRDGHGVSVLGLYSTYKGQSRIVPLLERGTCVTVPRTLVHYIATEWGVANLRGLSIQERASALIAVAHPDQRDALARSAVDLGLISYRDLYPGKATRGVVYVRDS